jgi:hypothetical protein
MLLTISCLVGIFFGLYYNVFALVPLTLVTTFVCLAGAIVHGETISFASFQGLAAACGLQGGFMIGLTGRDVLGHVVSRVSGPKIRRL